MTCPEIDLGEFGERLARSLGNRRVPLSGQIELTARCNLDCAHCYINEPAGDGPARQDELSAAQWFHVLDQIAAEGCLYLLITGGEVMLRPDFLEIYDHAKRKGFIITLFTNGTLITPEIADHLAQWPPRFVEITLYGATAQTFDRVTGVTGSYERCHRGIALLHERNIPLNLKSTLMTLNAHELEAMEQWAEELGARFRYDAVLRPRPDGAKSPAELRLSPEQVVALDLAHPKVVEAWREQVERHPGAMEGDTLYVCGAGLRGFHIDAYGCLSLCIAVPTPCFSLIRDGSFAEGWRDFLGRVRATKITKDYECRHCEVVSLCAICPSFSFYENGDAETPVEYRCQIAHCRAKAFGV